MNAESFIDSIIKRGYAMRLTKTDMSRVIIQALYGLETLPANNDPRVTRLARSKTVAQLAPHHARAVYIILNR